MQQSETSASPLDLLFFDLADDPGDRLFWSGVCASTIEGLRKAGHRIETIGPVSKRLYPALTGAAWHAYRRLAKLHYHAHRDLLLSRLFTRRANTLLARAKQPDAVVTYSTAYAGILETRLPIFVFMDASWGQIVETYPYFYKQHLPERVYRGGFRADRIALARDNVHVIAASNWAKDRLVQEYHADATRIHVLPFAPNLYDVPSTQEVAAALARKTGQTLRLLFAGKDFERKGGPIAVETVRLLREQGVAGDSGHHGLLACRDAVLGERARLSEQERSDTGREHRGALPGERLPDPAHAGRGAGRGVCRGSGPTGYRWSRPMWEACPPWFETVSGADYLTATPCRLEVYASWLREAWTDRREYVRLASEARRDYDTRLNREDYTRRLGVIFREAIAKGSPVLT